MIMIIAMVYIFLSYVIFHQQLKIIRRKSSAPPPLKKSTLPFLLTPPLKIQKMQSPPLFASFSPPTAAQCNYSLQFRRRYTPRLLMIYPGGILCLSWQMNSLGHGLEWVDWK